MTFPRRVPEHLGWTAASFCAPASFGYLWATAGGRRSLKNVVCRTNSPAENAEIKTMLVCFG
jgi:hypothetical protein